MTLQASSPPFHYRGADRNSEPHAALLARVLELVAEGLEVPLDAQRAWRAACDADAGLGDETSDWLHVTEHAAQGLNLSVERRRGGFTELLAELHQDSAAVVTSDGQSWWVVIPGRRGPQITHLSPRGESVVNANQLRDAVGDPCEWLHFGPQLQLDEISRLRDPSFKQHPWSRLRAFLRLDRRDLILIVIYAVFAGALTLATPIAVQALVNTIAFGSLLQPLFVLAILLLGALVLAAFLRAFETYVVEVVQRRIFVRVAEDLGRRVPRIVHTDGSETYRPELLNRFFDVITIQKSLSVLLLDGLGLALQMIAGMLLLAFYHPLLLAFDVILTILLAFVLWMGRGAVDTANAESEAKYKVAGWLETLALSPDRFRTRTGARMAAGWTQVLCRDYLSARRRHFRILMRQISGGLGLQVIATVLLLGVGGFLVIEKQLTLGQLVAAELVMSVVTAGFAKLGKHLEKAYDLVVAVKKLGRIVDTPCERHGGEPLASSGPSTVTLHDVGLNAGTIPLVSHLDVTFNRGDRVRIAGPSGTGKSALVQVLAGLREPDHGSITFNGIDLRRADLDSVRDRVTLVANPSFAHASILDNIRIQCPNIDEPTIRSWLALFQIDHVANRLPNGLDTKLLPNGDPLAATEARRLNLLISMLSRPGLLVLDRTLDSLGLNPDAYERVLDRIFAADAPWTLVVVSDEPRVIERCTRTLELQRPASNAADTPIEEDRR